ncbi:hypothetical protein ACIRBX_18190 [Kitasatospora sp. NPDC096147]|uniref:hypothetical protein n=1 Tax=Kitasatospora sp. NPDC096147 TaxID=3364093 RepID=UPI00381CAC09
MTEPSNGTVNPDHHPDEHRHDDALPAPVLPPAGLPGLPLLPPVAASLPEAVRLALAGLPARAVTVRLPSGLPEVALAQPELDRLLAVLVEQAVRRNPPWARTSVTAVRTGSGEAEVRIADQGPVVPGEALYWSFAQGHLRDAGWAALRDTPGLHFAVESTGAGRTVVLTLPLVPSAG